MGVHPHLGRARRVPLRARHLRMREWGFQAGHPTSKTIRHRPGSGYERGLGQGGGTGLHEVWVSSGSTLLGLSVRGLYMRMCLAAGSTYVGGG